MQGSISLYSSMAEEFLSNVSSPATSDEVQRKPIRHVLYGSRQAIFHTISVLHVKGYAETCEWSKPLPTQIPGQYMVILIRS